MMHTRALCNPHVSVVRSEMRYDCGIRRRTAHLCVGGGIHALPRRSVFRLTPSVVPAYIAPWYEARIPRPSAFKRQMEQGRKLRFYF